MCRFIGVVADEPAPIGRLIADDLEPFLRLACEHGQGWGVIHRAPDGTLRTTKEPERGDRSAKLRMLLDSCVTDMAVVHLRMASPGMDVGPGNTHPFGDAQAAFVHNGEIRPHTCLDGTIDPGLLAAAEGDTDSERYYLAVRSSLDAGTHPAKAIGQVANDIRLMAESVVSLNCLLMTPTGLYAYSEHDPDSEVIRRRGYGFFSLYYRDARDRTLIASEGWPHPRPMWQEVPETAVLEIAGRGRRATVHGT